MEDVLIRNLLIAILIILITGIGYLSLLYFEKRGKEFSIGGRFVVVFFGWILVFGYILMGPKLFEESNRNKPKTIDIELDPDSQEEDEE